MQTALQLSDIIRMHRNKLLTFVSSFSYSTLEKIEEIAFIFARRSIYKADLSE